VVKDNVDFDQPFGFNIVEPKDPDKSMHLTRKVYERERLLLHVRCLLTILNHGVLSGTSDRVVIRFRDPSTNS
jgi:hypothetical protein